MLKFQVRCCVFQGEKMRCQEERLKRTLPPSLPPSNQSIVDQSTNLSLSLQLSLCCLIHTPCTQQNEHRYTWAQPGLIKWVVSKLEFSTDLLIPTVWFFPEEIITYQWLFSGELEVWSSKLTCFQTSESHVQFSVLFHYHFIIILSYCSYHIVTITRRTESIFPGLVLTSLKYSHESFIDVSLEFRCDTSPKPRGLCFYSQMFAPLITSTFGDFGFTPSETVSDMVGLHRFWKLPL